MSEITEPPKRTPTPRDPKPKGTVDVHFKMIFWTIVGFTALFGILATIIAIVNRGEKPDPGLEKLGATFVQAMLIGWGAIAGLFGGKSIK